MALVVATVNVEVPPGLIHGGETDTAEPVPNEGETVTLRLTVPEKWFRAFSWRVEDPLALA